MFLTKGRQLRVEDVLRTSPEAVLRDLRVLLDVETGADTHDEAEEGLKDDQVEDDDVDYFLDARLLEARETVVFHQFGIFARVDHHSEGPVGVREV